MSSFRFPRYLYLLILAVFLLTACEPTCYPYLVVEHISILEGKPYLHVTEKVSWGLGCDITTPERYYVSPDAGISWKELVSPGEVRIFQDEAERKQIISCAADDMQVCYRITGEPFIEVSRDGGITWKIDWQMPAGRHLYMIRYPGMSDLVGVEPDLIPYDLAILETRTGYVVLIAYGNQGVLVKSEEGVWNRYPVQTTTDDVRSAIPIPYRAVDFTVAWRTLLSETTWIFLMAFCYLTLFATLSWMRILQKAPRVKPSVRGWLIASVIPTGVIFVLLVWLFIVSHRSGISSAWQGVDTLLVYVCFLPVIIGSVVLMIFTLTLPNHKAIWLSGLLALALALVFFALTWLPFGMWAWGIFPQYWQALILAGILATFVLVAGFLAEKNLVRRMRIGPGMVVKNRN